MPYVFYKLNKMKPGDEIFVEDKEGQEYTFRVYDLMTVEPNDYWTTNPVERQDRDLATELHPHTDVRESPYSTRRTGLLAGQHFSNKES